MARPRFAAADNRLLAILRRGAALRLRVRTATLVLGLLMGIAAFGFLYIGRGLTFFGDEWGFIYTRRAWTLDIFLVPHNEHLVLVPVALFKLLFVTVGLPHYWVYRSVLVGAHLVCVAVLFALARRRVGDDLALAAAVPVLFLGSAYEDLLWPFQVGFVASVAAGLGMLLALGWGGRRGDVLAGLLLTLSLASASLGVSFVAAALVEVLLRPKRLRRLWVPVVPLSLYGLWFAFYGGRSLEGGGSLQANVGVLPAYAAEMASAAFGGWSGLGPAVGRPLAVAALVAALIVAVLQVVRTRAVPARLLALLAAALSFWGLTGLARAHFLAASSSRYIYFGAVLLVLIGVELVRGVGLSRPALALVAFCAGVAVAGNIHLLRDGAGDFHAQASVVSADLVALEIAGPAAARVPSIDPERWWLIPALYFPAVAELGSPAPSVGQLEASPEPVRQAADSALVRGLAIGPRPAAKTLEPGVAPTLEHAYGGRAIGRGGCVAFRPSAPGAALEVMVHEAGIVVTRQRSSPVHVAVRRFADRFPDRYFALSPSARSVLSLPRGERSSPWRVRLATAVPITACGIARP